MSPSPDNPLGRKGVAPWLVKDLDDLTERHLAKHGEKRTECVKCGQDWCARCLADTPSIGRHRCRPPSDLPVWDAIDDGNTYAEDGEDNGDIGPVRPS